MTNEEAKVFLDNLKVCIEEHPIVADWLVEIADRKTEPMKTTDYCKKCNHKGCEICAADGSNPYCVPSRYEPQTDKGVSYSDHTNYDEPKTYVTWTEPQTDCSWQKGE